MKKVLSKFCGMFLVGALLALGGCADYEQDIQDLNNKLNSEVVGSIKTLEDAVKALETKLKSDYALQSQVQSLQTKLEASIKAVEDALDDYATKEDLEEANEAILGLADDLAELDAALSDELKELAESISEQLKDLEDDIQDNSTNISNINAYLETVKTTLGGLETRLSAAETKIEKNIEDIQNLLKRIGTAEKEIDDLKEANTLVNQKLEVLEADVAILTSRVQSLVYVPEYNDGKADITGLCISAGDKNQVVAGTSELVYKVSPAKYAKELALVAADVLSFDVHAVKTRAEETVAPALEIVAAELKDAVHGEILLKVVPKNFDVEFFSGEKVSYSAALQLVQENAEQSRNISSAFTNLVPAVEEAVMAIHDVNGDNITNTVVPGGEIPFDSRVARTAIDGHKLVFVYGNKILSEEELKALGFDFKIVKNYEAIDWLNGSASDNLRDCFVVDSTTKAPYVNITLKDDVDADKIGHNIEVAYRYCVNDDKTGLKVWTRTEYVIGKSRPQININDVTIDWSYALDAEADAQAFADGTASYKRNVTFAPEEFEVIGFPEGVDYTEILATKPTKVLVNGKGIEEMENPIGLGIAINKDNKSIDAYIDAFDWNRKYIIVAEFESEDAVVTLNVTVNTVDRNRQPLTLDLGTVDVEYFKNMTIADDTYAADFSGLYDALLAAKNVDDYGKDKWLADNFGNTEKPLMHESDTVAGRKSNGWRTNLYYGDFTEGYTVAPHYTYETFKDEVPTVVEYSKTFDTWYGQEVKIVYTVNFTFTTYDFEHVSLWVKKNEGSADYYSRVMGKYGESVESKAVDAFSVTNIALEEAFNIVDLKNETILDSEAIEANGIDIVFEIETVPTVTPWGIAIDENNVISYNDKDDQVDVKGNLYIVNDNNTRVKLPTSFDEGGKYATYVVKKYDPIGTPVVKAENPQIDVVDSKMYKVNMLDNIVLKDNRDGRAAYDLIVDGKWLIGNGLNGYADQVDVTDLYGLSIKYDAVLTNIPVSVRKYFTFNETTGELSFDASHDLTLVEPIDVPVSMTVDYTWGSKKVEYTVTFFRSNGAVVE